MKKDGFTLIELLATIVIIGIVVMIAVPNIIGLSNNIKNGYLIDDAKKLVAQAKYMVNSNHIMQTVFFNFEELNATGDIEKDPDGGEYDSFFSGVKYDAVDETYCVVLIGSKRSIGDYDSCVLEIELTGDLIQNTSDLGDPPPIVK